MYVSEPDPAMVIKAYENYYRINEFQKNEHTQYYKRWLRSFSRSENYDVNDKKLKNYIENAIELRKSKSPTSQWQSIGPWDFDRQAESRSYAPGAAHVYTVKDVQATQVSCMLVPFAGI